jgi:hypothetical protein
VVLARGLPGGGLGVWVQAVGEGGVQAQEGAGQGPFGLIERRQVDGGDLRRGLSLRGPCRRGHLLADHSLSRGELVEARGDQAPSSGPTAVMSSAPPRSGAIRAIV